MLPSNLSSSHRGEVNLRVQGHRCTRGRVSLICGCDRLRIGDLPRTLALGRLFVYLPIYDQTSAVCRGVLKLGRDAVRAELI
jgi:hypothetical protein